MDINLTVQEVNITGTGYKRLSVSLEDVKIQEIIDEVGIENILNEIGEEKAIEHFNIEVKE